MAADNVTLADLATYPAVHQWMVWDTHNHTQSHTHGWMDGCGSFIQVGASAEERLAHCNVTRWFDHIQHLPGIATAAGHLTTVDIHTDPVSQSGSQPCLCCLDRQGGSCCLSVCPFVCP